MEPVLKARSNAYVGIAPVDCNPIISSHVCNSMEWGKPHRPAASVSYFCARFEQPPGVNRSYCEHLEVASDFGQSKDVAVKSGADDVHNTDK